MMYQKGHVWRYKLGQDTPSRFLTLPGEAVTYSFYDVWQHAERALLCSVCHDVRAKPACLSELRKPACHRLKG